MHANTFVPALARDRLEKLIRYVARPAVCLGRLAYLEGGYVEMRFKSRWRDGSVGKVFEGPDAIAKLAMLIPPPNVNLLRYIGVYAGNHRWRDSLTPGGRSRRVRKKRRGGSTRPERERRTWADLMRRAFALDVLACPCGGRREVIALIEQRHVIIRILTHLGLPADLVSVRPARPPPAHHDPWAMSGAADPASCAPPPTRASDPGPDPWEVVDELVDEEDFSQALS